MIVYLARHGETFANRENVVLGRGDSPLTSLGIEALEALAARLSGLQIRRVLTSPLDRAAASAQLMAGRLGATVTVCDGLAELSCGEWEGKPRRVVLPEGGALRSSWSDAPPGGESYEDAEARVKEVVGGIRAGPEADPLLVVGHSVVNRVFLKVWIGSAPDRALPIRHPFDLVYVLREGEIPRWFDASGRAGSGLVTGPGPF